VIQAPTRQAEDELVRNQIEAIQTKLQEPSIKSSVLADCVVRSMLCSGLGHSVDFAHIHALQLAQKGSIPEKKIGYLGCVMFLKETDDLILLLINTILRDLQSPNIAENNMALITATYLVPREMSTMLLPVITPKVAHSREFIRKKSLIFLEHVSLMSPDLVESIIEIATSSLSDQDPGVAFVAIQVLRSLVTSTGFKLDEEALDGLCQVQRQILDKKLPKDYLYHSIPAPWAQIEIIQLIRMLVTAELDDHKIEDIIQLITDTIEQQFGNHEDTSMDQAIIFECILTFSLLLKPESDEKYRKMMRRIMRYSSSLLQSTHGNNIHTGLCALESLLLHQESGILPLITDKDREFVYRCLDHPDDSIQRKSFGLINALTTKESVKDVTERIISHAKSQKDHQFRTILIQKATSLIDKFPDVNLDWRVFMLLRLLQGARDRNQRQKIMFKMKYVFGEKPYDETKISIGNKLLGILSGPAKEDNAPETLILIYLWSLANFDQDTISASKGIQDIVERFDFQENVTIVALRHIFHLLTTGNLNNFEDLSKFLQKCQSSKNASNNVCDHVHELQMLLSMMPEIDLACDKQNSAPLEDFTLSYLDHLVIQALEEGSPSYDPNGLDLPDAPMTRSRSPSLRITPYNVMDESEWRSMSLFSPRSENAPSSTTSSSKNPPATIWTMKGRVKDEIEVQKEDKTNPDETRKEDSDFKASVIQDLSQWS